MEITTFFKCSCGHCGRIIEYLAGDAGKIVECPQCKEKSRLPEPEKLLMVEIQGPPLPVTKNCPVCGAEMKFLDKDCLSCATMRKKKLRQVWGLVSAIVVVLIFVVWLYIRHSKPIGTEAGAIPMKSDPVMLPQPPTRMPKSINDLKPGRFSLEQRKGSDVVMAVGDIANVSENVHHGLRVDVDVLDATGAKLGTITDYATELGARQTWHIVDQVTNSKAMSVKIASIKEEQ